MTIIFYFDFYNMIYARRACRADASRVVRMRADASRVVRMRADASSVVRVRVKDSACRRVKYLSKARRPTNFSLAFYFLFIPVRNNNVR